MRIATLAGPTDLDGFRRLARRLVIDGTPPEGVRWKVAADGGPAGLDGDRALRAPGRYRPADMVDAPPLQVPRRFAEQAAAAILHGDPARFELLYRLLWRLQREPGLRHDPLDPDWLALARLAQAVHRETPPSENANAGRRTAPSPNGRMASEALPKPATVDDDAVARAAALAAMRQVAAACVRCPLHGPATQTVFGEGPVGARICFVGEQPGDREDLAGRPFVGPSGALFDRALAALGIARDTVYVTNAVKHFKFELRGHRRIHKTPAQQEAAACLEWLEREIALVRPDALVALGATAARALLQRDVGVLRERGRWLRRNDGRRVLVTLHPSALLRLPDAEREAAVARWLEDLAPLSDADQR